MMIIPPPSGSGLEAAIASARKLQPEFSDAHVCKICLGRGGAKQCWGCGFWWHPTCLGYLSTKPGPLYCGTCRHVAKQELRLDYTYNEDLMQLVTTGCMPPGLDEGTKARLTK